jgi:thioesterase domain-containing protein
MNELLSTFVFLPGAGGAGQGITPSFAAGMKDPVRFESIRYPGWRRYVAEVFSPDLLIEELIVEIESRVPSGPIRLMGMSLGGHLAYAAALRLKERGREIAGLCVLDAFMIRTSQPTAGWLGRALDASMDLFHKRRFRDLGQLLRSKAWRTLIRLAGPRLRYALRKLSTSARMNSLIAVDELVERELSLRLLIQHTAPWLVELDRQPPPLIVPAALLRTEANRSDDAAWVRRCPNMSIREVPGTHHTLFDAENIAVLRREFEAATKAF